ncbi:MAG: hypothetical protein Q8J68_10545 [Methanolobus sp.]|uniref:DUF7109 family protein n=1 Tax=Methanolobus sp. TaxID=1874737 RepID=UPI0027300333|nr:hypothetical protein [Methanolobus sp.]MDP2217713.1 hypothetical protein [Methanolobus sp.]
MITNEELAGIIDALGALREDEICAIAEEISFLRKEDFSAETITEMCRKALDEHLIEIISSDEVKGADSAASHPGGKNYYIPGPNAFPDIPFELSEAIDILMMSKREVDLERVSKSFSADLHKQAMELGGDIRSFSETRISEAGLSALSERYGDILNLYCDYDSWLPGGMDGIEDELQELSRKLEQLRAAQGI